MKAILISVHAKWCALMMNGDKKVEVRKENVGKAVQRLIDEYGYADIYVYCTKEETLEYFYDCNDNFGEYITHEGKCWGDEQLNGKVLFKFRCYKVEDIYYECGNNGVSIDGYKWFYTEEMDLVQNFEKASCLNENELFNYLQPKEAGGSPCGYALHISQLEIFDEPKELSEFKVKGFERIKVMGNPYGDLLGSVAYHYEKKPILTPLTKAPQSWQFIEVDDE